MTMRQRPQRQLTGADHEVLARVETLCFHRMLHLGLVDPVPNPSPMSEAEGTWVREHAWHGFHHHIDDGYAWGFWRWAFCEKGTCWNCLAGRCEWCMHRQKGGPDRCDNTDWVHNHRGLPVARFILRPGGEPCVWWCRCPCAKTGPAPARPARRPKAEAAPAAKTRQQAPATERRQASLFETELTDL